MVLDESFQFSDILLAAQMICLKYTAQLVFLKELPMNFLGRFSKSCHEGGLVV
jgi:hypothetical protein